MSEPDLRKFAAKITAAAEAVTSLTKELIRLDNWKRDPYSRLMSQYGDIYLDDDLKEEIYKFTKDNIEKRLEIANKEVANFQQLIALIEDKKNA